MASLLVRPTILRALPTIALRSSNVSDGCRWDLPPYEYTMNNWDAI